MTVRARTNSDLPYRQTENSLLSALVVDGYSYYLAKTKGYVTN